MHKKIGILLLLLFPILLPAQITYHRYLDSSYVWFENYYDYSLTGPSPCVVGGSTTRYTRYHVIGEESLDGFAWYQIHSDWVQDDYCANTGTVQSVSISSNQPDFHIREDSMGRLFIRENGSARLLYDFGGVNMVGDTLWMNDHQVGYQVDSIDTVLLDNAPRARYHLQCPDGPAASPTDIVYEGIGGYPGFNRTDFVCLGTLNFDQRIVCCEKGGDTLVIDGNWQCGVPTHNPVLGIPETHLDRMQVRWSAADRSLMIAQEGFFGMEWRVVDMLGNVLRHGNSVRSSILLPDLAAGIYLFSATTQTNRYTHRFLVD